MSENEIMAQIHRHREEVARRCDYDVDKLFAYYKEQQGRLAAEGWRVVSFAGEEKDASSSVVREDSPKPEPET